MMISTMRKIKQDKEEWELGGILYKVFRGGLTQKVTYGKGQKVMKVQAMLPGEEIYGQMNKGNGSVVGAI